MNRILALALNYNLQLSQIDGGSREMLFQENL